MYQPVVGGGEAGQHAVSRLLRRGKGGAVDGTAVLGERDGLHPVLREDMHVVGPQRAGVGTAGRVGVVVAGGDDHLPLKAAQSAAEVVAIEQVACQQQELHAVVIGPVHHALRHAAALGTALAGLLRRQGAEGAVQMEVSGVKDADHHASSGCQPLQTSTHWVKFLPQQRSSSSQVSSMALAALPTAGNTVSKRFRDTSR